MHHARNLTNTGAVRRCLCVSIFNLPETKHFNRGFSSYFYICHRLAGKSCVVFMNALSAPVLGLTLMSVVRSTVIADSFSK